MKAIAIKKEMHQAIDLIDDKDFLKAVHTILNEKSKVYEYELSAVEIKELERLKKLNETGKSKSYTMSEVRKYAHSKLKK